eukprot:2534618-Prymnesium_polylepis.1
MVNTVRYVLVSTVYGLYQPLVQIRWIRTYHVGYAAGSSIWRAEIHLLGNAVLSAPLCNVLAPLLDPSLSSIEQYHGAGIRGSFCRSRLPHTAWEARGNPSDKSALFHCFPMAKWPWSRPIAGPCSRAAAVGDLAR